MGHAQRRISGGSWLGRLSSAQANTALATRGIGAPTLALSGDRRGALQVESPESAPVRRSALVPPLLTPSRELTASLASCFLDDLHHWHT